VKNHSDTILQLATARAKAAVHIIRISGPEAISFTRAHTRPQPRQARRIYYSSFINGKKKIDKIICFIFKAPVSYSGENMAEIHCHGSLLIVNEIIKTGIQHGLRVAGPGEFTQRAFLNGKMNIYQAEAVNTLINTRNDYLKENSLRLLKNKHAYKFESIKKSLIDICADLETAIEFPEQYTNYNKKTTYKKFSRLLCRHLNYLQTIVANYDKGCKIDSGIKVGIYGQPNSGKSTLMNLLLKEERVLVTKFKGTTRDFVKEEIFIKGFPVSLYDTAGIRTASDQLEKKSITRSLNLIKKMDIIIYLLQTKRDIDYFKKKQHHFSGKSIIFYLNKKDLLKPARIKQLQTRADQNGIKISRKTSLLDNRDLNYIEKDIYRFICKNYSPDQTNPALQNERQKIVIQKIITVLQQMLKLCEKKENEEILIEEIRKLNNLLDELNIRYNEEDIINRIFSKFCLGK